MNDALTKTLIDDFPKLYRNRHETFMQRGFECGFTGAIKLRRYV